MDAKELLKEKISQIFTNMDAMSGNTFRELWQKYDDDGNCDILSPYFYVLLPIFAPFSISARHMIHYAFVNFCKSYFRVPDVILSSPIHLPAKLLSPIDILK